MRIPDDVPLIALVAATAEWQAGTPPTCWARVRLLDRVHFTIHRGDCVVVHHADPAGARVLLAALAGSTALSATKRLRGERHLAPRVRVRRCSISSDALPHILEGWQLRDGAIRERVRPIDDQEPVVHLLRASRSGAVTGQEARQWRAWARRQRLLQGAVVAVARPEPVRTAHVVPAGMSAPMAVQLREAYRTSYRTNHEDAELRRFWLRDGQLSALREWQ